MSTILQRATPADDGTIVTVTPQSAGWTYVGFEAVDLAAGRTIARDTGARETCLVVISGHVHVRSPHGDWLDLGGRPDPFSGRPDAAYLPPRTAFTVEGAGDGAEIGLCHAPATTGAPARALRAGAVDSQTRGYDSHQRTVNDILMDGQAAERLLVCEVITPSGNWSSYPPHKHDRDALPAESLLEETYYHRLRPSDGFGLQRVYTDDRSLDETVAVHDRDVVLVPRGYHTVASPPGVSVYYLNVMAGPSRTWSFTDDPALAWTRTPGATLGGRVGPEPAQPSSHPHQDPR
jgi:5-deoxy-glucuronate isomerase